MFGFSRRRMKLGKPKVQLADSSQGTKSPIRHAKRLSHSNVENVVSANSHSDDLNRQCPSAALDLNSCTSGNSQNWMPLSIVGVKPPPRFNHAATVAGSKMVVVGGESGRELLEDVQVLNFDEVTWTAAAPKLYLSPTSLPLKIPACKGHSLVSWGKKVLLIGGKTDPVSERVSVWAFDVETECWSHVEAKGNIPIARSGHTVTRAGSMLILFGGEDAKGRKLNDLHMFDLKSFTWLPLLCKGTGPCARSNHVAALYGGSILFIFGGASKSRILNDLHTLDLETMVWSRIKIRGFHPTPRAGCCGVLCGTKWYIAGGGSRKKRHADTLVFDVLKVEWTVAVTSSPSSVTTNKGFSLVLLQHKDRTFLVAFGGSKKEPSNQVEILIMVKNEQSMGPQSAPDKNPLLFKNCSTTVGFAPLLNNGASQCPLESVVRQNLAAAVETRGSGRKSLSETIVDPNSGCGNISLRKQFHQEEEYNSTLKMHKATEDEKYKEVDDCLISSNASSQGIEQRSKLLDAAVEVDIAGVLAIPEESPFIFDSDNSRIYQKQVNGSILLEKEDVILPETDGKAVNLTTSHIYQLYETKMSALVRKNGTLEGQLAAALANREAVERNLSSAVKSRQEMERKLVDALKEVDLLKEKLAASEIAQEEANSLSNIVHSDNVRLERGLAYNKAVLDDTEKELHCTRGVLAAERARAFQLQVEVFHLKRRLQSVENRAPTPRKPFNV